MQEENFGLDDLVPTSEHQLRVNMLTRTRAFSMPFSQEHSHRALLGRPRSPSIINSNYSALPFHQGISKDPYYIPPIHPPITKVMIETELDIGKFTKDVKFMHELALNPDMKIRLADSVTQKPSNSSYWSFIGTDLSIASNQHVLLSKASKQRILLFFQEASLIMMHLYPKSAAVKDALVEQLLDQDLLKQQLNTQTQDINSIIMSIGQAMQLNCAPKRDVQIVNILKLLTEGQYGACAKSMFELMQEMKLDLVNYHVDHLRKGLIHSNHLISLEKSYFVSKVNKEKIKMWLKQAVTGYTQSASLIFLTIGALVRTISSFETDTSLIFPETLILDYPTRIAHFHEQFDSIVCHAISRTTTVHKSELMKRAIFNPKNSFYQIVSQRLITLLTTKLANELEKEVKSMTSDVKSMFDSGLVQCLINKLSPFIKIHLKVHGPLYFQLLRHLEN